MTITDLHKVIISISVSDFISIAVNYFVSVMDSKKLQDKKLQKNEPELSKLSNYPDNDYL